MSNLETVQIVLIVSFCLIEIIAWVFGIKISSMDTQIDELKKELKSTLSLLGKTVDKSTNDAEDIGELKDKDYKGVKNYDE